MTFKNDKNTSIKNPDTFADLGKRRFENGAMFMNKVTMEFYGN